MKQRLPDIINRAIESYLENIYTCLPGRIESYNKTKKKATVKPVIKKGNISYPVINEVPVIFPCTTAAIFHLPVKKGDGCLILFSKESLENYLNSNIINESEQGDSRKFSLSDAFCIPGLFPFGSPGKIINNTTDIVVEIDDGNIKINGDYVDLNGNDKRFVTYTALNTALQGLITALNSHIHPDPVSGLTLPPTVAFTLDISGSQTTTIRTGG